MGPQTLIRFLIAWFIQTVTLPKGDQDPGQLNSHCLKHGGHCTRVERALECSTSAVAAHSSLAGSSHMAFPATREPGSPAPCGHTGQKHVVGRPRGMFPVPARLTGGALAASVQTVPLGCSQEDRNCAWFWSAGQVCLPSTTTEMMPFRGNGGPAELGFPKLRVPCP